MKGWVDEREEKKFSGRGLKKKVIGNLKEMVTKI